MMSKLTNLMIAHSLFDDFHYDTIIDWAIELLEENNISENIQIAAGLQKPVNVLRQEITSMQFWWN